MEEAHDKNANRTEYIIKYKYYITIYFCCSTFNVQPEYENKIQTKQMI